MLDFLTGESKEQRATRKQREQKVKQLKNLLGKKRKTFHIALELHQQSMAEKWEYLEVSTKNIKQWNNLNKLGGMGWELVGVATFAEGGGYKEIHTLYVLKRRIYDWTQDLRTQASEIAEIESQIEAMEKQK